MYFFERIKFMFNNNKATGLYLSKLFAILFQLHFYFVN